MGVGDQVEISEGIGSMGSGHWVGVGDERQGSLAGSILGTGVRNRSF